MLYITGIWMGISNFADYRIFQLFVHRNLRALSNIYSVHGLRVSLSTVSVVIARKHMGGFLDIQKHQNKTNWWHHFLIWWVQLPNKMDLSESEPSESDILATFNFIRVGKSEGKLWKYLIPSLNWLFWNWCTLFESESAILEFLHLIFLSLIHVCSDVDIMEISDSESESAILELLHTVRVRVGHF